MCPLILCANGLLSKQSKADDRIYHCEKISPHGTRAGKLRLNRYPGSWICQTVKYRGLGRVDCDIRASGASVCDIYPVGAKSNGQAVGLHLEFPPLTGRPRKAQDAPTYAVGEISRTSGASCP